MENIKDYILAAPEKSADAPDVAELKPKKAKNVEYTTVFVSGPDFAVRRKTAKTSQVLVLIVSKQQYYIKHETDGGKIEELSEDNYFKFVADLDSEEFEIRDENGNCPFWINTLPKTADSRRVFLGKIQDKTFSEYACKNTITFYSPGHYATFLRVPVDRVVMVVDALSKHYSREEVKKAFGMVCFCNYHRDQNCKLTSVLTELLSDNDTDSLYKLIERKWGVEGIRQMINAYCESPLVKFPTFTVVMQIFTRRKDKIRWNIYEPSKDNIGETIFELRSFLDYMFGEVCNQGFADSPVSFWSTWSEYLDMQMMIYGEVNEKYSECLFTDENKLSFKVRQIKHLTETENFRNAVAESAKYNYKGSKYSIFAPKSAQDMIAEGQMQGNCVASYVDRVSSGCCQIFFMRANNDLEKSLVTVEIRQDGSLGQVKGKYNHEPKYDEMCFVERWYAEVYRKKCSKN